MGGSIVLVGCGKMGGALLAGWLDLGVDPAHILVVEPDRQAASAATAGHEIRAVAAADAIDRGADVGTVVFAVKPQAMDDVVGSYSRFAAAHSLFVSVAAGKSIRYFERRLGADAAIVRAMPNLPAAVRRGVTVACANRAVTEGQRAACTDLLTAVGAVEWIDDESMIDAVTAVSGSGPAYVFLLAECMASAGAELGLAPELAARLARLTVEGAGELLHRSDQPTDQLRRNVTSHGGTTAAALEVLMTSNRLSRLMSEAVAAAARRSRELAE